MSGGEDRDGRGDDKDETQIFFCGMVFVGEQHKVPLAKIIVFQADLLSGSPGKIDLRR